MHPIKLQKLKLQLYCILPFIGGSLRQQAAQKLAQDKSPEVVRVLAKKLTHRPDQQVKAIAKEALLQMQDQSCIDAACAVWAATRHLELSALLVSQRWIPNAPSQVRVLSALKSGKLEVITDDTTEVVALLLEAANDSDPEIAQRAIERTSTLTNPETIDHLCQCWSKTRNKHLEQAIVRGGYVARQPIELRVLTALKVGQLAVVTHGRAEVVEPLIRIFNDVDQEIAERAIDCASTLQSADAIDYLCTQWMQTRDCNLQRVLLLGKYVARRPIKVRVLSALKTGKRQPLKSEEEQIIAQLLAARKDNDPEIATQAIALLGELQSQSAIDALCKEWAYTRDKQLTQVVQRCRYVATAPTEVRVLSALKVGQLAVVTSGGIEVAELLIKILKDKDNHIVLRAQQAASALTNPDAIDHLCNHWAKTRDRLLEQAVIQGSYVVRQPVWAKVLSALKTGKRQILASDGAAIMGSLLKACKDSDPKIAAEATALLGELQKQSAIDQVQVEVEDAPQRIVPGEFDIEIEG